MEKEREKERMNRERNRERENKREGEKKKKIKVKEREGERERERERERETERELERAERGQSAQGAAGEEIPLWERQMGRIETAAASSPAPVRDMFSPWLAPPIGSSVFQHR